ncbi:recombinase family protein [Novosphingobium sp. NDB2Meth1]|uniref:recombinase family protein n=1 Tax=Novosphingobium sp. NDB2Meth1 TaxID=1892847 RepID=UPI0009318C7C|nr:recombinase family protein [Novosphingobium sp. NDB2Meth1]
MLRCAVYTRKSNEDGLEQEFNSLHAQREACEAYILSQRHEGWTLVPQHYDDGGFSGGNMDRPGLKALLADIDAGRVDVIVVYKVDRLTRSLADFAKIVERLDAKSASFVSVTQAFNTTTSMGRLTLNVLLSFAQFEREVTGERIRDKIAASKKKGLWMGGPVPLGYQVIERKLIPVPEEAERVRTIMRLYLEIRSVPALTERLRDEGIVTKIQQRTSGPHRGGIPFARGSLFHLLKNPVYRGRIVHKGMEYDGQHEAIVPEDLWDAVQAQLKAKAPPRRWTTNQPQQAMLRGLLTDREGRPMVPTYGSKQARRYAYYETRKDLARPGTPSPVRVQRGVLEKHLIQHLVAMLTDEHAFRRLLGITDAGKLRSMFTAAKTIVQRMQEPGKAEDAFRSLVQSVAFQADHLAITLEHAALDSSDGTRIWAIPLPQRKPFREAKLRMDADSDGTTPDRSMLELLADAQAVQQLVRASPGLSMNQIAASAGRCRTQLTRLLRLSWLSPRIVEVIAGGTQPRSLTRKVLMASPLPTDWAEQERLLGIPA